MLRIILSLLCLSFIYYPSLLQAKNPKDYFLRLYIGSGLGNFSDDPKDSQNSELEYSGVAGMFGLEGGYMFYPTFSMDLGFTSHTENNPQIKRDNEKLDTDDFSASYAVGAFTLGFSYYPSDGLYISPELRYVFNARESFGGSKTTFTGLGTGISIGKEWQLSAEISLGLALSYVSDTLQGSSIGPPKMDYEGEGKFTFYGIALSLSYD